MLAEREQQGSCRHAWHQRQDGREHRAAAMAQARLNPSADLPRYPTRETRSSSRSADYGRSRATSLGSYPRRKLRFLYGDGCAALLLKAQKLTMLSNPITSFLARPGTISRRRRSSDFRQLTKGPSRRYSDETLRVLGALRRLNQYWLPARSTVVSE